MSCVSDPPPLRTAFFDYGGKCFLNKVLRITKRDVGFVNVCIHFFAPLLVWSHVYSQECPHTLQSSVNHSPLIARSQSDAH